MSRESAHQHVEVLAVRIRHLSNTEMGKRSKKGIYANADMQSRDIREFCRVNDAGEELLKMAITKLGLSARAYDRIIKVARSIADLAACEQIKPEHVSEAIQYRTLDRSLYPISA